MVELHEKLIIDVSKLFTEKGVNKRLRMAKKYKLVSNCSKCNLILFSPTMLGNNLKSQIPRSWHTVRQARLHFLVGNVIDTLFLENKTYQFPLK